MKQIYQHYLFLSNIFCLSDERVFCHYWPNKKEAVAQFVIPECYIPKVLTLVHDGVLAGHAGKEYTLNVTLYFWPTMSIVRIQVREISSSQGGGSSTCTYAGISPT